MQNPSDILKEYWGYTSFRGLQQKVIDSVLSGEDVIALLPTGAGKSLCYQVPAMAKEGICIVVSPLISLIQDQVENLSRRGIRALSLIGELPENEINRLLDNCLYGGYKFLYISPERLQNEWVIERLQELKVSLIAIDEAHCISHWGKGFRPSYLLCKGFKEWLPNVPMIALTATATTQVIDDIKNELSLENPTVIKSPMARPNLAYMVYKVPDKFDYLLRILTKNKGSSVVYLRNRKGVEEIANRIETQGITATYFHGGLSPDEKEKRLSMWLIGDVRVMVATNAFGMGIDKPDVRTVIHLDIPQSIEDYTQEVGRAGRDGKKSFGVLLYDDFELTKFERNFQNSISEIYFLKLLYRRLNQYFNIAIYEGRDTTHSFDFQAFCERFQLPSMKVYNGLLALERAEIITKNESFQKKNRILIKATPQEVVRFMYERKKYYDILNYLIRNYTTIYHQMTFVELKKLSKQLQYSDKKIENLLQELSKMDMIDYQNKSTDMEITFRVSRDDDRTINSVSPLIKDYNKIKEKQYQAMLHYLTNTSQCRSLQLLEYFGEEMEDNCGICSYCIEMKIKEIENE